MIDSFIISFKLKNTYRVNSFIYSIKQIPIIKKFVSDRLYENEGLKIVGSLISGLIEIGSIFIGKLLYIFLMIAAMLAIYKTNKADTFLHLFVFLTLSGGFLNTFMFNPSKDKYYAMILMDMDAKKYTLSNYYYSLMKVIVGMLPFTIIFGLIAKVPLWICILLPFFTVMIKMIFSNYCLYRFSKSNKITNENLPSNIAWICIGVLIATAYGLPYLGIAITQNIFLIIFLISLLLGIISFNKINNFKNYKKMYKQILTNDNINYVKKQSSTAVIKDNISKQIKYDKNFVSNKEGFAYFHELFVKRHKKILTETVKKQAIVILAILIIGIIVVSINSEFNDRINRMLLIYLPYFVFIMYLLNRGTTYTQAIFMNCDHSMLSFRVFRTPRVILGLFKERLKTLIFINLIPTIVIAIGLPLLLYITGGTDNIFNYGALFLSIISMSIFFSVHNLVMYYLLQPYNVSTELKSSTYKIMQTITYFVCYCMIKVKIPTIYFGGTMIVFSILYCFISLYLVYRYAPKTYKIRI